MRMFTQKNGEEVEVKPFTISEAEMTSLMAMKEDYEQRGEHLSMTGVVLEVLSRGRSAIRHSWNQAAKNKAKSEFAKFAPAFFNADGTVRDPEGLAKLAIAKGLVKGTSVEMSGPVEEEVEEAGAAN